MVTYSIEAYIAIARGGMLDDNADDDYNDVEDDDDCDEDNNLATNLSLWS